MKKIFTLIIVSIVLAAGVKAQQADSSSKVEPRFSVLFGLNQPIVFHGFNFEVSYWTKKWVFDYSHGIGLQADGKLLGDAYTSQHLDFKIAHSLGAGVGYRITEAFNVRFEPKVHFYETYYEGDAHVKSNSLVNFRTYTLGLGAYYRWMPFAGARGALKGITIAPSVRYWYKAGSTLHDGKYAYFNERTHKNEVMKAPNIGISNTPFVLNVSVGYSF